MHEDLVVGFEIVILGSMVIACVCRDPANGIPFHESNQKDIVLPELVAHCVLQWNSDLIFSKSLQKNEPPIDQNFGPSVHVPLKLRLMITSDQRECGLL